jgi:hypothetical protein
LRHYYPWDLEPIAGAVKNPTTGAADLYNLFRNPLAHALGMGTTEIKKVIHRKPFQFTIGIAKDGLSEDLVEELERSATQPGATIKVSSEGGKSLSVSGLYWGVRQMIFRLTNDTARMAAIAKFLS